MVEPSKHLLSCKCNPSGLPLSKNQQVPKRGPTVGGQNPTRTRKWLPQNCPQFTEVSHEFIHPNWCRILSIHSTILGLPSPVFPGILLFRKPSKTLGNNWFLKRTRMVEIKNPGNSWFLKRTRMVWNQKPRETDPVFEKNENGLESKTQGNRSGF